MDFTRIDSLYAAKQSMKKLEEEHLTSTHKVLTITTEETTHKVEHEVIHNIERKPPVTYFKKLNHPEDIPAVPTKPVPSYTVERKTAKRIPIRNEFIEGNENDLERYYWSNRIEVVDGKVIVTPILKRIEA